MAEADETTKRVLEMLQSNLGANQAMITELVRQNQQTAMILTQTVEMQREMARKIEYVFSVPEKTSDILEDAQRATTEAIERLSGIVEEIKKGLGNGFMKELKEDMAKKREAAVEEIKGAVREGNKTLVFQFSFVFGGIATLMMFLLYVLKMWHP
jgi:hypothetical protein